MEPEGSSRCLRKPTTELSSEYVESILHLCTHFSKCNCSTMLYFHLKSGIETGYGLDDRRSSPGRSKRFFSAASRPALGLTQPPILWVLGALSPG
jgi:hypothetical protein